MLRQIAADNHGMPAGLPERGTPVTIDGQAAAGDRHRAHHTVRREVSTHQRDPALPPTPIHPSRVRRDESASCQVLWRRGI